MEMETKPSIVEIVSGYISLRRSGKEHVGLCPFHNKKTPSFYVNEEKGLYYCHGCGERGDVITFIQQIEQVDFRGALAHLGLASGTIPRAKPQKSIERQASEVITAWACETSLVLSAKMRDLLEQSRLARACLSIEGADEALEGTERQWEILNILDEDLFNPQLLPGLWGQRESIEAIING